MTSYDRKLLHVADPAPSHTAGTQTGTVRASQNRQEPRRGGARHSSSEKGDQNDTRPRRAPFCRLAKAKPEMRHRLAAP